MTKYDVLKTYFGYDGFRSGQEPMIDALLAGQDALAIMPTGSGKSVCYQVPALLLPGVTLVVSPLVSLMRDQVTQLVQMGVPAAYLNSSLNQRQYMLALDRAKAGRYKIIYVAPERLDTESFLSFVRSTQISLVAVDEAHCISQWGQDFRPAYLNIPQFVDALPQRPAIGAFTATATPEVGEDIQRLLALREPLRVATGFDRENLYFEICRPQAKEPELLARVKAQPDQCGIIYCATRKNVEAVCDLLLGEGISATRYHAGLSPAERQKNQEDFLFDRAAVMVATNAFGMGIDKSNVRYVIHYNMPKDLESYYQEAGRAGRDGAASRCILLYSGQDVRTNQYLITHSETGSQTDPKLLAQLQERDLARLRQMTHFCQTRRCLRQHILNYFGQSAPEYCGACYNCLHNFDEVDVGPEVRLILRCVAQTGQRFGAGTIAAVLCGADSEKIRRYALERESFYGALSDFSQREIQDRIRFLLDEGILTVTEGQYPLLQLGEGAQLAAEGDAPMQMKVIQAVRTAAKPAPAALDQRQAALFERLRVLRAKLARLRGVPAFVVFSDKTLYDMAASHPRAMRDMLAVSGVGAHKAEQYGEAFLTEISQFDRQEGT